MGNKINKMKGGGCNNSYLIHRIIMEELFNFFKENPRWLDDCDYDNMFSINRFRLVANRIMKEIT